MKKTININIAGIVFHIEEDAFEILNNYLNDIKAQFSDPDERIEIVNDIESRIAELFTERQKQESKNVISTADVDYIQEVMGKPSQFNEDYEESTYSSNTETTRPKKRLYKLKDEGKVEGVCEGLGAYFNVDPVIFRVVFIASIFFGGTGLIAYIIMAIAVPNAKTTADKLRARGENPTVENIKNHFDEAKSNVKDLSNKGKEKLQSTGFRVGYGLSSLANFIAKVLGIFILFAGFMGIGFIAFGFLSISGVPVSSFSIDGFEISQVGELIFENRIQQNMILIPAFLATIIPVIFILYFAIRLVFNLKRTSVKGLSISLLVIWLLSIGTLFFGGLNFGTGWSEKEVEKIQLEIPLNKDVLTLESIDKEFEKNLIENDTISSVPDLKIRSSKDSTVYLKIVKSAHGRFYDEASQRVKNISYDYAIDTNKVSLSSFYSYPKEDKIRDQEVDVYLYLPDHVELNDNQDLLLESRFQINGQGIIINQKRNKTTIKVDDEVIEID